MSTYTGLDLAPSAPRWTVRDGVTGAVSPAEAVYGMRGCPAHPDYDSATTWSDPLAFRRGEFSAAFGDGVEKTVAYEECDGHVSEWLRAFFRGPGRHPAVDLSGTVAAAVPDHATPEDRDDVLAGLASTRYAGASLVWRPVAAVLAWLEACRAAGEDLEKLAGRRVFVLDLDGGRPELSQLALVRHREREGWIVPSRQQPRPGAVASDDAFARACYRAALAGVREWEQLVGGQFYPEVQAALESGRPDFAAWIRRQGAWTRQKVTFAAEVPRDLLRTLNPLFLGVQRDKEDIFLVNGWIVRRYGEQLLAPFRKDCGRVEALPRDAVAHGASLFAERLAKGLPTFYDRIADYRFWDAFKAEWTPMFDCEQEVEPGRTYRKPAAGEPPRRLRIEKYATEVSFYVRETSSTEYARRIRTDFTEFLREDLDVHLTAEVSPEKGSASFMLSMADPGRPAVFVAGKTRAREIVLRWRALDNPGASVAVDFIDEHQGYVDAQPVLGRIYDSEDNLRMVEAYVAEPRGADFAPLWAAYQARFRPNARNGLADRVGYHASPREPTRGLFGTKYVPNARVDRVTPAYAQACARNFPITTSDGMKFQNYCHAGALPAYKESIRNGLRTQSAPGFNFNYYYAPGYVLGDEPDDIRLLLAYLKVMTGLGAERSKLWWAFFRMLCWHPESKLEPADLPLLESCLGLLCDQDAAKALPAPGAGFRVDDRKYLVLAILYALRIRESGSDLSAPLKARLVKLLTTGLLAGIPFPPTMVPNLGAGVGIPGDTLSAFVVRFIQFKDTLGDRELGAAMGGV